MDPGEAVVEVVTGAFLVAGAWVTARITGKGTKQAAEVTAEVQKVITDATREDAFIRNLSLRLGQLESLDSERVTRIQGLETRLGDLEEHARLQREEISTLRRYIRRLLDFIRSRGLAHEVPPPPPGVQVE